MSKHDVRFVPISHYSSVTNGPAFTATSSNTTVTAQWYRAEFCDCARCRVIEASKRAIRRFGAALERLAR